MGLISTYGSYFIQNPKDVIRGMHFQIPPDDHSKIVFPMHGSILDVVVDIRNSPTSGNITLKIFRIKIIKLYLYQKALLMDFYH